MLAAAETPLAFASRMMRCLVRPAFSLTIMPSLDSKDASPKNSWQSLREENFRTQPFCTSRSTSSQASSSRSTFH